MTLIEIVVAFLIIVIVFGVLASLFQFSTEFFRDENTQVASQDALRIVAVNFEKDVRRFVQSRSNIVITPLSVNTTSYVLGNATSNVTYTFNSSTKEVRRGSQLIATGVNTFAVNLTTSNTYLNFEIVSNPDQRGNVNRINITIYLRIESSG